MIKRALFFAFILVLFLISAASAGDIQLEAMVDRDQAEVGEALQLNLIFQGTQNVPAPSVDKIDGFDARYLGPSTMVSIINGVVTNSTTHIYTLFPLKTGIFTIGPFSAQVDGKTLNSKPITIKVTAASAGQQPVSGQVSTEPAPLKINAEELKDRIFLVLNAGKTQVYLNEIIPLTVKLYVNRLGVRDIQFPEMETNDFSAEKFGQPKQYREESGGVLYDVIEFSADMFAMKPGEFTLGPAKLKCNLVMQRRARAPRRGPFDANGGFNEDIFNDFFGRYEAYPLQLKSAEFPVKVLPLPLEGKPEGFEGALGNFYLYVEAAPLEVKAGDPVTLKMTVRGKGNFDSVKTPKLQSRDGFKVYDPQIKQGKFEKIFEQVLIPESEKITRIPRINFSFFDTQAGQYQVLTQEPVPITVAKAEEAQAKLIELPQAQIKLAQKEELGRDIIYLKNSFGKLRKANRYLYQDFGFWFFQIISLVLFFGVIFFHFKQQKLITNECYARRRRAPAEAKKGVQEAGRLLQEGKTEAFFDAVFKTIREYAANRFHLSSGGITALTLEELAEEKGIDAQVLNKIKKIFSDCDMARYAPAQFNQRQLESVYQSLKEIISYLEKRKK